MGCELPGQTMETDITPEQISRTLNIRTIYEFVETMDRRQDDLHMIQEAIEVNGHIAQLGAAGDYGLNIGHGIRNNQEAGLMGHDVVMDAVAMTASGVDAEWREQCPGHHKFRIRQSGHYRNSSHLVCREESWY